MKPQFFHTDDFEAVLADKYERSFLFRRVLHLVKTTGSFCMRDEDETLWRPHEPEFLSDAASVPHPFDWFIPALNVYRYKWATMGIHDPACRTGKLDRMLKGELEWTHVVVPRSQADSLLAQGIDAMGGWKITQGVYWLGVRAGAGLSEVRKVLDRGGKRRVRL